MLLLCFSFWQAGVILQQRKHDWATLGITLRWLDKQHSEVTQLCFMLITNFFRKMEQNIVPSFTLQPDASQTDQRKSSKCSHLESRNITHDQLLIFPKWCFFFGHWTSKQTLQHCLNVQISDWLKQSFVTSIVTVHAHLSAAFAWRIWREISNKAVWNRTKPNQKMYSFLWKKCSPSHESLTRNSWHMFQNKASLTSTP